jgi:hypothetical protein
MKYRLLILFLAQQAFLLAQPGFNKVYPIGNVGGTYANGITSSDTIFVVGNYKDSFNYIGVALNIMDTFGNLISRHPFYSPNTENLLLGYNYQVKHLSDGTIGFFCNTYLGNAFIRYRRNGELVSFTEVPIDSNQTVFPYDFEPYKDGYMVSGAAVINNEGFAFLSHTDANMAIRWTRWYRKDGYEQKGYCMKVLDENTIVIGTHITANIFTPDAYTQSNVIVTDSLGDITNEWTSDTGYAGVGHIERLDNGDWLYVMHKYYLIENQENPDDIYRGYKTIIRADNNFNTRWETRISPTDWGYSRPYDLLRSHDGHWVVCEYAALGPYLGFSADGTLGCVTKITEQGDILWQTCDSARWEVPIIRQEDKPIGHFLLPSGSTIMVGTSNRYQPGPPRSFGWMVKLDANGCITAPCTLSSEEPTQADTDQQPDLFPNPAHTALYARVEAASGVLYAYNAQGQLIRQVLVPAGSTTAEISVADWPIGLYHIRFQPHEGTGFVEKVVIQR